MKQGYITVNLFRVSHDSLFLDIHMQCTKDYYFSEFKLEVRYATSTASQWFDLTDSLFINTLGQGQNPTTLETEWIIRLPLSKINIPIQENGYRVPAIYIGHVKVVYRYNLSGYPVPYQNSQIAPLYNIQNIGGKDYICYINTPVGVPDARVIDWNGDYVLAGEPYEGGIPYVKDTMLASDVNMVYRCMLDELQTLDTCNQLSDTAIRNYLLLYGHNAALSKGDLEQAEVYLKLISNCFGKCLQSERSAKSHSCNCRK